MSAIVEPSAPLRRPRTRPLAVLRRLSGHALVALIIAGGYLTMAWVETRRAAERRPEHPNDA